MEPFTIIEIEPNTILIVTSEFIPGKICCLDKEGNEINLDGDTTVKILQKSNDHFIAESTLSSFLKHNSKNR